MDKHFPHLTVGQTLEFAASVRTPQRRAQDMSRSEYCQYIAKVVMAVFGLSHTYNTKVGNDFIRGVSGGERKRVSIAEMVVAGSPLTAWDNRLVQNVLTFHPEYLVLIRIVRCSPFWFVRLICCAKKYPWSRLCHCAEIRHLTAFGIRSMPAS